MSIQITALKVNDIEVFIDQSDGELMVDGAGLGCRSKADIEAIAEGLIFLAQFMEDE